MSDIELILLLNSPDTRLPYSFTDTLQEAEQTCTHSGGLGFTTLPYGSTLGAVLVVGRPHTTSTTPIGWHPLDNVPVHDECTFMYYKAVQ